VSLDHEMVIGAIRLLSLNVCHKLVATTRILCQSKLLKSSLVHQYRRMSVNISPYGSWESPISSKLVSESSVVFQEIHVDSHPDHPDTVYWTELRFDEGGRYAVCSHTAGTPGYKTWTPKDFNARTRVHEYGGGASFIHGGKLFFSNYTDQCMYTQTSPDAKPERLTKDGQFLRYADGQFNDKTGRIYCVREDHGLVEKKEAKEAVNTVVTVNPADGTEVVLCSGADFYSCPRVSPDGKKIAWVQWYHPNMPWDSTELWVADLWEDGGDIISGTAKQVAGGKDTSVMLPSWTYENELLYVGDQTDWWNLYLVTALGEHVNLVPRSVECGGPQWIFGQTPYMVDPRANGDIFMIIGNEFGVYNLKTKAYRVIDTGFTNHRFLNVGRNGLAYCDAGSPTKFSRIIQVDLASGKVDDLRESKSVTLGTGYFSIPEEVKWTTSEGQESYGYFYKPANQDFQAPDGTLPPLLVKNHGGPTASTNDILNLKIQYFTSRGMAVLDVNYRGSTGYGKTYRHSLRGKWGLYDVEDSCTGAQHLADTGKVDGNQLCIDGGSAGGYTTLAALTFKDVFKAGASHYGIGDLLALVEDTHKFESRYIDTVIGPSQTEEDKKVYKERSPINYIDKLDCALALFQGDEDKIVPPNQAEMMYKAVKEKGKPTMYVLFKGEQHGFRKAENIQTALDGEFYFFSKVFGFEPADKHINIPIDNLN